MGEGGRQGLFFHQKYGTRKRPACHRANTCQSFIPGWKMCGSAAATASGPASSPRCRDWVCFAVCAEEWLGIFIPCPEQLNANCKASGSAFKKRGRETHERVAWHLELVSNSSQISQLPAVSQPTRCVLIHTFEIPRVKPLELICQCSKETRANQG